MIPIRRTALLLLPAMFAGAAIADPPSKGEPKVGDRLAVYKPASQLNLNAAGAYQCETC